MLDRAALVAGVVLLATRCDEMPAPNPVRDAALIEAAAGGRLDDVDRLLEDGARVTATDGAGRTALVAAAYGNHVEVVRLLVEEGDVDVTIADAQGVTALEHARAKEQREIVAILEAASD